jgi:hypothetical protein
LTGISILAFQRLRVYTHSSPSEPFHFLFRARIVPAAPNCRSGVLKTRYHGFWQCFFQTPLRAGARWGSISRLPQPVSLLGWHRQRRNPPHHGSEQPPRQVALRQEQPIVPGEPANAALPPLLSWKNHEQSCSNWNARSAFGWREYKPMANCKRRVGFGVALIACHRLPSAEWFSSQENSCKRR